MSGFNLQRLGMFMEPEPGDPIEMIGGDSRGVVACRTRRVATGPSRRVTLEPSYTRTQLPARALLLKR
jgi:hypothetical protein